MANPTKAELQAQLTELNISFPEKATVKQLLALVPVAEQEEPEDAGKKENPAAKATTQAQVIDSNGNVIRTYTLEVHGENFLEYSESYARKIGGTVR